MTPLTLPCYLSECGKTATESVDVIFPALYGEPETTLRVWGCAEHVHAAPHYYANELATLTGRPFVAIDEGFWKLVGALLS